MKAPYWHNLLAGVYLCFAVKWKYTKAILRFRFSSSADCDRLKKELILKSLKS